MGIKTTEVSDIQANDLLVAIAQRALIENSVIAGSLWNVSQFAKAGLSSISFPKRNTKLAVKKKTANVATDSQTIVWEADKLDLDQHAYIRFCITESAKAQSVLNLESEAIQESGAAHAEDLDGFLYALLYANAADSTTFTGNTNATIALADIVDARQYLKSTKVKPFKENIFLAVNSKEEADMLKIDGFIDASKYGDREPIYNGEIGRVYGTKILVSEEVDAEKAIMYHRDALAWGLQLQPSIMVAPDLNNIGMGYVIHQLYGAKVMRSGLFASKVYKS